MFLLTLSRCLTTSKPATLADPEEGFARVHRILIVVDLPAPFGPRKPKVSPAVTAKLIPRTASISPYRLTRSVTWTTGSLTRRPPACRGGAPPARGGGGSRRAPRRSLSGRPRPGSGTSSGGSARAPRGPG